MSIIAAGALIQPVANAVQNDQPAAPELVTIEPSQSPVERVDQAQAEAISLLRGAPEDAPDQVRQDFLGSGLIGPYGLNLDLARSFMSPASPLPIWVVPGRGYLCIWIKDPVDGAGVSCDKTATAVTSGLIVTLVKPGEPEITIAGVLPDEVTDVAVGDHALPVKHGTFGAEAVAGSELRLKTADGARAVELARPDDPATFDG